MSSPSARELAREAFMLGFMVSREGFNADCPFPHLAPATLATDYIPEVELRVRLEAMEEWVRLREMMVKRLLP